MPRTVAIVQEIRTIWTKAARGGEGAVQRNAIPDVARIPPDVFRTANGLDLLHHRLVYKEHSETGFTSPAIETVVENATLHPYPVGCVEIGLLGGEVKTVWAAFRYDTACGGAPERGWMRKTLHFRIGEWGQIFYNGRFTPHYEGNWWYEKTVINVGLFALPLANGSVFTRAEPSQRFSAMAHLF